MQQNANGPKGPKPVRPAMPVPPRRRPAGRPDPRLLIVHRAVMIQGAAYSPDALAEETGLPVDAIHRFAAQIVVDRDMVDLGMIEPEDAIRMGSKALAASLRIVGKGHKDADNSRVTSRAARPLRTADLIGMRRVAHRIEQTARPVTPAPTPRPNCGIRPGLHGGAGHQKMAPTETPEGLPNV